MAAAALMGTDGRSASCVASTVEGARASQHSFCRWASSVRVGFCDATSRTRHRAAIRASQSPPHRHGARRQLRDHPPLDHRRSKRSRTRRTLVACGAAGLPPLPPAQPAPTTSSAQGFYVLGDSTLRPRRRRAGCMALHPLASVHEERVGGSSAACATATTAVPVMGLTVGGGGTTPSRANTGRRRHRSHRRSRWPTYPAPPPLVAAEMPFTAIAAL